MPISFRPNASVWIWLDSDKDIEFEKRPRFLCRVLTCEQVDKWYESLAELREKKAGYDEAIQLILTQVTDWANFTEPFSAEAVKRVLTMREVWNFAHELPGKVGLQENDLKN